jgi:glutamate---cysteine ligase / carboxylate-amine ligase
MKPLHLFAGYGIELEYMITDNETLSVLPVSDKLIHEVAGAYVSDVYRGRLEWSNELALHVIELKTAAPEKNLESLNELFHKDLLEINQILHKSGGRLMPGAMHPWMDPFKEMKIWPHDNSPVYEAYNRIFDCRGHGWSNLQSMHINLPFGNDEEFGRLHAAIRLILPILPALAASSPVSESKICDFKDQRLEVYRKNQAKIPSITGEVIPEGVFTKEEYIKQILEPLYLAIAPHDIDNVLKEEWLNSRGAIARFDRNALEIRLIDMQECPHADLSIAAFVSDVLKAMVHEKWCSYYEQKTFHEDNLFPILRSTIKSAENSFINDRKYLRAFGFKKDKCSAQELWEYLFEKVMKKGDNQWAVRPIKNILENGTLSTRIIKALNADNSDNKLHKVYNHLCNCLEENTIFVHA